MKLWVRSQNRKVLQEVNNIFISAFSSKDIYSWDGADNIILGTYKTKKRALEVLDEIQRKINSVNLGCDFGSPMIDLKNPTYIYEMPKN